jgi:hypothetical protein
MSTTQEAVTQQAKRMSRLWRAAAWDELARCFSDGVVQVGPRLKDLSRGRAAVVAGYRVFRGGAQQTEYREANFRTEVWPGFATTVYDWRMRYVSEGEKRFSSGTDQFIFEASEGNWIAVWRFIDFWEDRADG